MKSKVSGIESELTEARRSVAELESIRCELTDLKIKHAEMVEKLGSENRVNAEVVSLIDLFKVFLFYFMIISVKCKVSNPDESHHMNQLLLELKKEQEISNRYAGRCSDLTKQLTNLESALAETREKLIEAASENRRTDLEQVATHAAGMPPNSPPAKRSRRTRTTNSIAVASSQVFYC